VDHGREITPELKPPFHVLLEAKQVYFRASDYLTVDETKVPRKKDSYGESGTPEAQDLAFQRGKRRHTDSKTFFRPIFRESVSWWR
jgi:hypothetical protein